MNPTIPNTWLNAAFGHGHFATHEIRDGGRHVLARDRAGVHKLFYGIDDNDGVRSSNYLADLLAAGIPFERTGSVPPGGTVEIQPARGVLEVRRGRGFSTGTRTPMAAAARVRTHLSETFDQLAERFPRKRVYVAFSGGLDSTVILALAKERWSEVVGITFGVEDEQGRLRQSDDLDASARLAEHFGIRREVIRAPPRQMLESIDPVLVKGQDHRDFNVHCGMVNWQLARGLAELASESDPLILTGDGMNELTADYSAVEYEGRVHYALPRLKPSQMRRFLVEGLDAGDREVGIYAAHGIRCVQPYLLTADTYLGLDGDILDQPMGKQKFVELTWGERIPDFVYRRPKVRAQEGSAGTATGSMAVALDAGFDSRALLRRFAELFGITERSARGLIRAGRYRSLETYPLSPALERAPVRLI